MSDTLQYSAQVDIYFLLDGLSERVEIAGCLDRVCTLRNPMNHPPCQASLVINIDGNETRKRVYLKNGLSEKTKQVEFEPISA